MPVSWDAWARPHEKALAMNAAHRRLRGLGLLSVNFLTFINFMLQIMLIIFYLIH